MRRAVTVASPSAGRELMPGSIEQHPPRASGWPAQARRARGGIEVRRRDGCCRDVERRAVSNPRRRRRPGGAGAGRHRRLARGRGIDAIPALGRQGRAGNRLRRAGARLRIGCAWRAASNPRRRRGQGRAVSSTRRAGMHDRLTEPRAMGSTTGSPSRARRRAPERYPRNGAGARAARSPVARDRRTPLPATSRGTCPGRSASRVGMYDRLTPPQAGARARARRSGIKQVSSHPPSAPPPRRRHRA